MEKLHKDILEIKRKLALAGIVDTHLVYMPVVPFVGYHEFMIEEHFGLTVAKLISPPND